MSFLCGTAYALDHEVHRPSKANGTVRTKADLPGLEGLPQIVTRTEFLALQMRYGFQRAVALVRARIELAELENALRGSRPIGPIQQLAQTDALGEAFQQVARQSVEGAFLRGATEGNRALRNLNVQIRFDSMNPHAATFARTQSSRLITSINESQREAVRNLVETSVAEGRTVFDIARDIRNIVGLRPDQVNALSKYRELVTGRPGLTIDQIESKVRRYADALLRQRGELIARTEVLSAANAGQVESWLEARRQGLFSDTMGKQWVVTADELLCPECEALDGQTIGLTEGFESEGNSILFPPAHPNCRCSLILATLES